TRARAAFLQQEETPEGPSAAAIAAGGGRAGAAAGARGVTLGATAAASPPAQRGAHGHGGALEQRGAARIGLGAPAPALASRQSAQTAGLRGFIRYGWRWSWRITAFVTIFQTASTGLSLYYDKVSFSHYVAAGALTGGLFRIHVGLRGLAVGSIFGALLSIPAGGLMVGMQKLSPETMEERQKRKQRELYEQKTTEWKARLNSMEIALEEMERDNERGMEEDAKRIQQLLNLPENSLPSEDRN
uniref:Complex I assembly factor TIMMDC1, mitochondrial n=1 Tax=Crocodylus porosus TaxID=8502 RepID=A0A7M4EY10_CROPO